MPLTFYMDVPACRRSGKPSDLSSSALTRFAKAGAIRREPPLCPTSSPAGQLAW